MFNYLGRQPSGCDLYSVDGSWDAIVEFLLQVPSRMDPNFNTYIYMYNALTTADLTNGVSLRTKGDINYYVRQYNDGNTLIEIKCEGYYVGRQAFVSYVFGGDQDPLLLVGVNTAGKNLQDRFENEIFYGISE